MIEIFTSNRGTDDWVTLLTHIVNVPSFPCTTLSHCLRYPARLNVNLIHHHAQRDWRILEGWWVRIIPGRLPTDRPRFQVITHNYLSVHWETLVDSVHRVHQY